MLKVIKGNLWELAPSNAIIVHGCNAQGVMGSGFAKQVKEMYPEAYEAYIDYHKTFGLGAGWIVPVAIGDMCIVNAITQYNYGRDPDVIYVRYHAVKSALEEVVKMNYENSRPIYLPFIGAGLANGNPVTLLKIFAEVFKDYDAYLVIND